MGPLIDSELERVDRKHAQLSKLSGDLVEALSLYHMLMREPQYQSIKPPYGYTPPPTAASYNGMPPNMPPQMVGPPRGLDRPPYMTLPGNYMPGPPGTAPAHLHMMQPPPQTAMGPQGSEERPQMPPHFQHT